jgi:adenosylhomocysteine nucleosidase
LGPLGIVTGMPAEAALIPKSASLIVRCAGPGKDAARRAAEDAVAEGAAALVSFGLAGGLDPSLAAGAVILANAIVARDGTRRATDAAWRERLFALLGPEHVTVADIAAADGPVVSVAEKRGLFAATGAAAVEMESGAVEQVARAAGLPFLAVRVIADPAGRAVPPSASKGLRPDGRPDPLAILGRLAARPGDTAGLIRLAGDYRRARRRLRDIAIRAGGLFGLA